VREGSGGALERGEERGECRGVEERRGEEWKGIGWRNEGQGEKSGRNESARSEKKTFVQFTSAQKLLMASGGYPLLRSAVSVNSLGSSQSLKK